MTLPGSEILLRPDEVEPESESGARKLGRWSCRQKFGELGVSAICAERGHQAGAGGREDAAAGLSRLRHDRGHRHRVAAQIEKPAEDLIGCRAGRNYKKPVPLKLTNGAASQSFDEIEVGCLPPQTKAARSLWCPLLYFF